jgi:hypothetical protein
MSIERAIARRRVTAAEAAARVRAVDELAIGLGPGQPAAFLHALGERDDFERLVVFGALISGLYRVFTRRGVTLLSGFFGPVERGLREAGHDVRFVPADFRRAARSPTGRACSTGSRSARSPRERASSTTGSTDSRRCASCPSVS